MSFPYKMLKKIHQKNMKFPQKQIQYSILFSTEYLLYFCGFFKHFIRKNRPLLTEYIFFYFWGTFLTFYIEMTTFLNRIYFFSFWGNFIFFLRKFYNTLYITVHLFLRKNGSICTEIFFTVIQKK